MADPVDFNPRSPCGERHGEVRSRNFRFYFNPRSPCGERLRPCAGSLCGWRISIHAPRAGSDCCLLVITPTRTEFQSTLPVRGATPGKAERQDFIPISIHAPRAGSDEDGLLVTDLDLISIHAPRAGSDSDAQHAGGGCENFNPRSPCGERHLGWSHTDCDWGISIHAPRAGSDLNPELYL